MSRLLTLLMLYQNGYLVGQYISIEKAIADTKDSYYDALARADPKIGMKRRTTRHRFIKYMLGGAAVLLPGTFEDPGRSGSKKRAQRAPPMT